MIKIDDLMGLLCGCWGLPLLVLGAVVSFAHTVRQRLRARGLSASDPHCGHCRYIVRGVSSWQCPECGSDLRHVGILTRQIAAGEPLPLGSRVLLWMAAVPGPFLLLFFLLFQVLPIDRPVTWWVMLCEPDARPPVCVLLSAEGTGTPYATTYRSISISLQARGQYENVGTAYPHDRTVTLKDGSRFSLGTIENPDASRLAALLGDHGFAGDDLVLNAKAMDVLGFIDAAAQGRSPNAFRTRRLGSTAGRVEGHNLPPAWLVGLGVLSAFVMWLLGVFWLIRGYHRALDLARGRANDVLEGFSQSLAAVAAARSGADGAMAPAERPPGDSSDGDCVT
jgi:hypothetical protein